jgi:hypothetical protein
MFRAGILPFAAGVPEGPASRYAAGRDDPEENLMGFMDKAKKLAEQAQQKLDEAQQNFNKSASPQAQPQEGGVRYDEHGRPIQEDAPAAAAPAPPADPGAPPPPPEPAPERDPAAAEPDPAGPEPTRQPQTGESGGGQADTSPDPFKPLQQ